METAQAVEPACAIITLFGRSKSNKRFVPQAPVPVPLREDTAGYPPALLDATNPP